MARAGGISGVSVAIILGGSVLLYAGLKGKGVSDTVRSLIGGQSPESNPQTTGITGLINSDGSSFTGSATPLSGMSSGNTTFDPGTSAVGGTKAKNKAIGKLLAAGYGWSTGAEWDALDKLWTQESQWDNTAENPNSGAYGISQALPPSKLPAAGQKPISSASAQIAWGLAYIKGRYGDPLGAWAHEQANNWY